MSGAVLPALIIFGAIFAIGVMGLLMSNARSKRLGAKLARADQTLARRATKATASETFVR